MGRCDQAASDQQGEDERDCELRPDQFEPGSLYGRHIEAPSLVSCQVNVTKDPSPAFGHLRQRLLHGIRACDRLQVERERVGASVRPMDAAIKVSARAISRVSWPSVGAIPPRVLSASAGRVARGAPERSHRPRLATSPNGGKWSSRNLADGAKIDSNSASRTYCVGAEGSRVQILPPRPLVTTPLVRPVRISQALA